MYKKTKGVIVELLLHNVHGRITPMMKKCFDVLLDIAREKTDAAQKHEIKLRELKIATGCKSEEELKDGVRALFTTTLYFCGADDRGRETWKIMGCLTYAQITEDCLVYSIEPFLVERFQPPQAREFLDLAYTSRFRSKYALALCNFCFDYKIPDGEGRTPLMPLTKLSKLLGCAGDKYGSFAEFNRSVLKKAMAEVNKKSGFRIMAMYQKTARTTTAIQFIVMPLAVYATTMLRMNRKNR